jgi:hypothetical protein
MRIKKFLEKFFFYYKWDIGVYRGNIESFINSCGQDQIIWLNITSKYAMLADPFIKQTKNGFKLLAEYVNFFTCKGKIVSLEIKTENLKDIKISDEIETPFHMSYPYVFDYEGAQYCIPETFEAGKLMLYKYDATGDFCKYEKDLIKNFAAIDSTIFYYNNKWWLFCTKGPSKGNTDLFIWHSDNPLSGWQENYNNPVKIDLASARPAGHFFYMDGKLYRPSQNSSTTYGGSIIINEVMHLDESSFQEQAICEIKPAQNSKYKFGLHTLCIDQKNGIILVDGKRREFSIFSPIFLIIRKIRNSRNKKLHY